MLQGIFPILFTPFTSEGRVDEASLRRVVRFELAGGAQGLGVGGFASEAYKLTDAERLLCAEIVADEVAGRLPLIIGLAPGSTEAAIHLAHVYAELRPAALMVLPPATMKLDEAALAEHYIAFADSTEIPIMIQQSPQIQAYAHTGLSIDTLVRIAKHAPSIVYMKIEGPGSAAQIAALRERLGERVHLFGGVGGIGVRDEWQAGAAGLLPGCGFNELFVRAWDAWTAGDVEAVERLLGAVGPLVEAVSGRGHEFSLHARKFLFHRAGLIASPAVRRPTVATAQADLEAIARLAELLNLRIMQSDAAAG